MLGAVSQAVIAVDPAGFVLYWNTAAEQTYGWSAAEAVGCQVGELIGDSETTSESATRPPEMDQGRWSSTYWIRRRDGSRFLAHATDTPVLDANGR